MASLSPSSSGARRVLGARALFVERREAVHRVGRRLGMRARAAVGRDELLEAADGDLARLLQLRLLDRDLAIEAGEDLLLLRLVVKLDDRRDGVAVLARALLVGVDFVLQRLERSDLLRASAVAAADTASAASPRPSVTVAGAGIAGRLASGDVAPPSPTARFEARRHRPPYGRVVAAAPARFAPGARGSLLRAGCGLHVGRGERQPAERERRP